MLHSISAAYWVVCFMLALILSSSGRTHAFRCSRLTSLQSFSVSKTLERFKLFPSINGGFESGSSGGRYSSAWKWQSNRREYVNMALGASTFMDNTESQKLLKNKKFVVVTGGVISGIGKGVTASSIGVLMKMMRQRPTAIKIDPYLNVDAGTMSPFEHGEVFVLDDGGETDLDLGNYERFLDVRLSSDSNLTTGKVYAAVIAKERRGEYLGKTVQIIPHITNEIIEKIIHVANQPVDGREDLADGSASEEHSPDVCVIELGGTIGDIESMPFVEALRQLQLMVPRSNFCLVHVSMVPTVGPPPGEKKTKPTQHSVKELRSLGLAPDFIVCRSATEVDISSRQKISLFCNVPPENVVSIYDVPNIYHVPSVMIEQRMHSLLAKRLQLGSRDAADAAAVELDTAMKASWEGLADKVDNAAGTARIALVGKYCDLSDSYLSVTSALKHACIATDQKLDLVLVESTNLELEMQKTNPELYAAAWEMLNSADGVLVPGGFGVRGIEGKVQAIRYAREAGVPFLGICLGMQAAVIEYARAMLNKPQANSSEFAPDIPEEDAAVVFMPEGDREKMGGTMRLGVRKTIIKPESLAHQLYEGRPAVLERHRHRYEVNPLLVSELESHGLRFTGKDEANQRMEIVELDKEVHPYFIAAQFHPEFKSRPQRPAPLFYGLLQAVKEKHASAKSGDYAMNLNADPSAEIASSTSTVKTTPATAD